VVSGSVSGSVSEQVSQPVSGQVEEPVEQGPALGRIDASWRGDYIAAATATEKADVAAGAQVGDEQRCVFCKILGAHSSCGVSDSDSLIVHRGSWCVAILNKYPYSSGHFMVMPIRHVGELALLSAEEHTELWSIVRHGTTALERAYSPEGINIGANLGRAAGAGVPGHLHVHLVPRWNGDTNFMTAIGEVRVVPEALDRTWSKLTSAW
jgi:ATP adenylyltransferase